MMKYLMYVYSTVSVNQSRIIKWKKVTYSRLYSFFSGKTKLHLRSEKKEENEEQRRFVNVVRSITHQFQPFVQRLLMFELVMMTSCVIFKMSINVGSFYCICRQRYICVKKIKRARKGEIRIISSLYTLDKINKLNEQLIAFFFFHHRCTSIND